MLHHLCLHHGYLPITLPLKQGSITAVPPPIFFGHNIIDSRLHHLCFTASSPLLHALSPLLPSRLYARRITANSRFHRLCSITNIPWSITFVPSRLYAGHITVNSRYHHQNSNIRTYTPTYPCTNLQEERIDYIHTILNPTYVHTFNPNLNPNHKREINK
jgi:hypothetical protein